MIRKYLNLKKQKLRDIEMKRSLYSAEYSKSLDDEYDIDLKSPPA